MSLRIVHILSSIVLLYLCGVATTHGSVWISEFMASNDGGLEDNDDNNFNGWETSVNGTFTGSTWRAVSSGVGYEESEGYGVWIGAGGDFETEMSGVNSSVFLRLPFSITDPLAVNSLTLRMRWDAGFVAYINGVEVAANRKPATLSWNSSSIGIRCRGSLMIICQTGERIFTETLHPVAA